MSALRATGPMTDFYPSRCEAQPRILPRLDPVFHGSWRPGGPIGRMQAEQFDADGYLVLKDVFSPDEIALLQREASGLLADPSSLDAGTVITERGGDEVRSIFKIHEQCAVMARLTADERLAGVARGLLDDDVYVHQSRLNYKPGFQ